MVPFVLTGSEVAQTQAVAEALEDVLLAQGMGKTMYQATSVIVFWAINLFKFVPYAALGIFTRETVVLDLWLAPAAIFGAWLGVKAHHVVPERPFFALTYVLLLLTGTKLIWDALT